MTLLHNTGLSTIMLYVYPVQSFRRTEDKQLNLCFTRLENLVPHSLSPSGGFYVFGRRGGIRLFFHTVQISEGQQCPHRISEAPLTSGLLFLNSSTVRCQTFYTQACAFMNHLQSVSFITGGLQSRCRNISAPELNFKCCCKGSE